MKNDFNLNIPRYVDNFEKEEDIDLNALLREMSETNQQIAEVQRNFVSMLKELTSEDEEIMASLQAFIGMIEG